MSPRRMLMVASLVASAAVAVHSAEQADDLRAGFTAPPPESIAPPPPEGRKLE